MASSKQPTFPTALHASPFHGKAAASPAGAESKQSLELKKQKQCRRILESIAVELRHNHYGEGSQDYLDIAAQAIATGSARVHPEAVWNHLFEEGPLPIETPTSLDVWYQDLLQRAVFLRADKAIKILCEEVGVIPSREVMAVAEMNLRRTEERKAEIQAEREKERSEILIALVFHPNLEDSQTAKILQENLFPQEMKQLKDPEFVRSTTEKYGAIMVLIQKFRLREKLTDAERSLIRPYYQWLHTPDIALCILETSQSKRYLLTEVIPHREQVLKKDQDVLKYLKLKHTQGVAVSSSSSSASSTGLFMAEASSSSSTSASSSSASSQSSRGFFSSSAPALPPLGAPAEPQSLVAGGGGVTELVSLRPSASASSAPLSGN